LAKGSLEITLYFDFLTLEELFHECELKAGLVAYVEKFMLGLGAGFIYLGRQYRLSAIDQDFYPKIAEGKFTLGFK
jgi:predicted nuclease of restriction endonuclease-like (RecB) superfamily